VPPPDLVVVIVDASNLQRNLYFATQVIELGYPTLVALNMIDVAEQNGHHIDAAELSLRLGVPVFPMIANTGRGVPPLREEILSITRKERGRSDSERFRSLTTSFEKEVEDLTVLLARTFPESRPASDWNKPGWTGAAPPSRPATRASRKFSRPPRRRPLPSRKPPATSWTAC
jgi:ferrous iron transport protein B